MEDSESELSLPPDVTDAIAGANSDAQSDMNDSLPPSIHSDEDYVWVQHQNGCACRQQCYKKVSADKILAIKNHREALQSKERHEDGFNQVMKMVGDQIDQRLEHSMDGTTVCRNMWQDVYGFSSTIDKYRKLVLNGHTRLPIRGKTLRGARPAAYEAVNAWSNPWPTSGL